MEERMVTNQCCSRSLETVSNSLMRSYLISNCIKRIEKANWLFPLCCSGNSNLMTDFAWWLMTIYELALEECCQLKLWIWFCCDNKHILKKIGEILSIIYRCEQTITSQLSDFQLPLSSEDKFPGIFIYLNWPQGSLFFEKSLLRWCRLQVYSGIGIRAFKVILSEDADSIGHHHHRWKH